MGHASFWPTPDQELLLRAALGDGADALSAWQGWSSRIEITKLDGGSQRLLPLVYLNLRRLGVQHPLVPRLKSIYQLTWYQNHTLFQHLEKVLQQFASHGVRTMVLKGVPLTLKIYRNFGARPMSDLDIMVPRASATEADALLQEQGWSPFGPEVSPEHVAALAYERAGVELDLHFSPFQEVPAELVSGMWDSAEPISILSTTTSCLSRSDQLLHVLAHGANTNRLSPIRWIPDSVLLLKAETALDWNGFLDRAHQMKLTGILEDPLNYLSKTHKAAVPTWVLDAVVNYTPSRLERLEYFGRKHRAIGMLSRDLGRYRRRNPHANGAALLFGFPAYLQQHFQSLRIVKAASRVGERALARLGGRRTVRK